MLRHRRNFQIRIPSTNMKTFQTDHLIMPLPLAQSSLQVRRIILKSKENHFNQDARPQIQIIGDYQKVLP